MPRPSEYELERQANIQRNQELLKSLGIFHAEVAPSKKAAEEAAEKENRKLAKKRPRASDGPTFPPPRRKSARIAASSSYRVEDVRDNMSSDPIDFLNGSRLLSESPVRERPVVKLRKLSPPSASLAEVDEQDGDDFDPHYRAALPTRDEDGTLHFEKAPEFTPNMTPEEMIRAGSFGGTFFQERKYSILDRPLPSTDYLEFPEDWYSGLSISTYLTSPAYRPDVNKYKVKAGQTLSEWEAAGWVRAQDPRGWFQWYCRFYLGRRTPDDGRQIRRWLGVCGSSGRFKKNLVKKVAESGGNWDDEGISPVVRQTLQHWGYKLTEADYRAYL